MDRITENQNNYAPGLMDHLAAGLEEDPLDLVLSPVHEMFSLPIEQAASQQAHSLGKNPIGFLISEQPNTFLKLYEDPLTGIKVFRQEVTGRSPQEPVAHFTVLFPSGSWLYAQAQHIFPTLSGKGQTRVQAIRQIRYANSAPVIVWTDFHTSDEEPLNVQFELLSLNQDPLAVVAALTAKIMNPYPGKPDHLLRQLQAVTTMGREATDVVYSLALRQYKDSEMQEAVWRTLAGILSRQINQKPLIPHLLEYVLVQGMDLQSRTPEQIRKALAILETADRSTQFDPNFYTAGHFFLQHLRNVHDRLSARMERLTVC